MSKLEKREANFLTACGVDLSNGFFSEDVAYWKRKEPLLYTQYVVWR